MFASPAPARQALPSRGVIRRRRLTALAALAATALSASYLAPTFSSGAHPARAHVVRPGETLWTIARSAYGGDPRPQIAAIERRNGLHDATLAVGQVLVLP